MASFSVFHSFENIFLQKKTIIYSGIPTQIYRVECEHADHKTTTTDVNEFTPTN